MLLGKTESGTYRLARGEELAAILVQSESTEETHSFGPPLRLCDLLFSFSRGRGLALNPYLKDPLSGEEKGRDDRIIAINQGVVDSERLSRRFKNFFSFLLIQQRRIRFLVSQ